MAWVARRLHPPRWILPCVPCCVLGCGRFSRRPARGRASCLGVFKRPPLRRSPLWSPLPPTLPPASARCRQAPCSFRPRGVSPPRRFAPPERSQACCILLPTMGFTGFQPPRRAPRPQLPAPPESVSCLLTDAPPSRAPPDRVAVPRVSAGHCPLVVHQLAMLARPRGLAPHVRPLRRCDVAIANHARDSHGLPFLKHACRLSCLLGPSLARPPCGPSTCSRRPLPDPAPEGTGSEVVAPTRPCLAPVCSTRGWCLRTRGLLRIRPVSVSPRCARDPVARSPWQTAIMFRLPLQHPRGDASHSDLA